MAFENPLQNFLLWGAILFAGSALYQSVKWGVKAWQHRKDRPPGEYGGHQNGDRPPPPPLPDE